MNRVARVLVCFLNVLTAVVISRLSMHISNVSHAVGAIVVATNATLFVRSR